MRKIVDVVSLVFILALAAQAATVNVHLPREVTVENSDVKLADVAIITGDDQLSSQAGSVSLGSFSRAEQQLQFDRAVIMSRLASEGISKSSVKLTGAQRVRVSNKQRVVEADRLIEGAKRYLQSNFESSGWAQLQQAGSCKDLSVDADVGEIELFYRLISADSRSASVGVDVHADGRKIDERTIRFRAKFERRVAVTTEPVEAGQTLTPENVKIEKVLSDTPESPDWQSPYGQVASRALPEQTQVDSHLTGRAQPKKVIERNESVVIRISGEGFVVTANGRAMQQGRVGQQIWVRNTDSQRRLLAQVNEDGSVEPVY